MTPAARLSAAITVLDRILGGEPVEQALTNWGRASRFAGSGDRHAVRDLVFDALRCKRSFAALGGGLTGRGLILGGLRAAGADVAALFLERVMRLHGCQRPRLDMRPLGPKRWMCRVGFMICLSNLWLENVMQHLKRCAIAPRCSCG